MHLRRIGQHVALLRDQRKLLAVRCGRSTWLRQWPLARLREPDRGRRAERADHRTTNANAGAQKINKRCVPL
jgi:hypothetical protein